MKTSSQLCTDAAQALMVEHNYLAPALGNAGAHVKQVDGILRVVCDKPGQLGSNVIDAADELGWETNDFRIFLLLNAAGALK